MAQRALHVSGSRLGSDFLGQNQAVNAIATGMAPQIAPHWLKIDQMNATVSASAPNSGQIEGSGMAHRLEGRASTGVVRSASRLSLRMPCSAGMSSNGSPFELPH